MVLGGGGDVGGVWEGVEFEFVGVVWVWVWVWVCVGVVLVVVDLIVVDYV